MNPHDVLMLLAFVAAGVGVGLIHFGALWWSVRAFVREGSSARLWGLQLGRFVVTGIAFFGIAQLGAPPLLGALVGFLAVRHFFTRRIASVT